LSPVSHGAARIFFGDFHELRVGQFVLEGIQQGHAALELGLDGGSAGGKEGDGAEFFVGVVMMLRLLSGEQIRHKRQSANESENSEVWGLHDSSNVRRAKRSHSRRGSQHAALIGDGRDGTAETHVWETGKAYWLPANAPNTKHADVNAGAEPIEVMVVELEKEK
jgi:hypothetical protein